MFAYLVELDLKVEQVLQSLEQQLSERKFQLLWKYDVPTKLFEKGIHLEQKYWILEISHPDLTKKMLLTNPISGLFLPCKIAVYSDPSTGKTLVGLLRPTSLVALMEDHTLRDYAQQLEEMLIHVLNEVESGE